MSKVSVIAWSAALSFCLLMGCREQTAPDPVAAPEPETAPELEAAPDPQPETGTRLPQEPLVERVLTKEEQAALSPDEVIKILQEGNERFVGGDLTLRDHSKQVRAAASGQYPKAAILSCVDSRVPVEDVFDRGIGDVFVARVAGNFENQDIVGSMEFATKVAGAKLIMVLGHEGCGAVKGAIDNVELGNLTKTLANIEPAIEALAGYAGEKTSENEEYVHLVAEENVRLTVDDIVQNSEVISGLVESGGIKVVGAMYDLDSGKVAMVAPRQLEASP